MDWKIFCSFFLFFFLPLFSSSDRGKEFQLVIKKIDGLVAFIDAFQGGKYEELKRLAQEFGINQREREIILADALEQKTLNSLFFLLRNKKWDEVKDLIDGLKGDKYFFVYQEFSSLFKQFNFLNFLSSSGIGLSFFSESLFRLIEQEKSWLSLFQYVSLEKREKLFAQFSEFLRKEKFYSWKKLLLNKAKK